jgi:Na+/melibiose symporter-like transporter
MKFSQTFLLFVLLLIYIINYNAIKINITSITTKITMKQKQKERINH